VLSELKPTGKKLVPVGVGFVLAVLLLALVVPTAGSVAQEMPAGKTLYQRMGGYDVIAGVVDDLLTQLKEDPAFERFGGGRSEGSLKRTRQLIVDQICSLAGGPCVYFGRDMKPAHAGLKITEAEWDSMIKKFKVSLDKFKVAGPEQKEFIAMIEKFRSDIVEKPQEEKPTQN
jgi:hemoglobin